MKKSRKMPSIEFELKYSGLEFMNNFQEDKNSEHESKFETHNLAH